MKMVCPFCGLGGTAGSSLYGRKVRCPECQKIFRVNSAVIVGLGAVAGGGAPGRRAVGSSGKRRGERAGSAVPDRNGRLGRAAAAEKPNRGGTTRPATGQVKGYLNTCSKCGFQLSETFMKHVDNQPVCAVCAG